MPLEIVLDGLCLRLVIPPRVLLAVAQALRHCALQFRYHALTSIVETFNNFLPFAPLIYFRLRSYFALPELGFQLL
jgi:hypothetical protein